ncbi:MAG: hypothetical protein HC839_06435 [Leptolyngbyaceae cyanobacterium RM2_2_21]|nr:hypothetical protein [Leptolyngbyaceae cyanobacterium RM2_2_21]
MVYVLRCGAALIKLAKLGVLGFTVLAVVGCDRTLTRSKAEVVLPVVQSFQVSLEKSSQMNQPLLFDAASDFENGLAVVRLGDRLGYIDPTGSLVINVADANISLVSSFSEDRRSRRQGTTLATLTAAATGRLMCSFVRLSRFQKGWLPCRGEISMAILTLTANG